MLQSVQVFIGKLASLGESIKNLFNFTVPFLSCLAIIVVMMIGLIMFIIPVKYIFMVWGVHKFTRKILRPNRIANNEVLDLLSRVPDDEMLVIPLYQLTLYMTCGGLRLGEPSCLGDKLKKCPTLDYEELPLEELDEDTIK